MKIATGKEINVNRVRYVDEIPDEVVDQIQFEGDEKEVKKKKEAWVKKYKFVSEKKDSKSVKDVDSNLGS